MDKKYCPKGHCYSPSEYGDQCPVCASQANMQRNYAPPQPVNSLKTNIHPGSQGMGGPMPGNPYTPYPGGGAPNHTRPVQPISPTPKIQPQPRPQQPQPAKQAQTPVKNVSGDTRMRDNRPGGGHTVIRIPGEDNQVQSGRRLVGFLVSYNRNPNGRAYNIYEGRNSIGRDSANDIAITEDKLMSGRHLSILYRAADGKFKFRDEQSSNGTYVNKELIDEGELHNHDVIRAGSTIFVFIEIPKIG